MIDRCRKKDNKNFIEFSNKLFQSNKVIIKIEKNVNWNHIKKMNMIIIIDKIIINNNVKE